MSNSCNFGHGSGHGDDDPWNTTDEAKELIGEGQGSTGCRQVTLNNCLQDLFLALKRGKDKISHRILDRIERIYGERVLLSSTYNIPYHLNQGIGGLLEYAVRCKMTSVVKRLAGMSPVENRCLLTSLKYGNAEVTEALLEAGCSPSHLLRLWLHSICWKNFPVNEEQKGAWKPLLAHWEEQDVMQSVLLKSVMCQRQGGRVLALLETIGMNFTACVTLRGSKAAIHTMMSALALLDHSTVHFLIERGFDISNSFGVSPLPLLHYFISRGRFIDVVFHDDDGCDDLIINFGQILLDLIREGENPLLRDTKGRTAVDLFTSRFRTPSTQTLRLFDQKCFLVLTRVLLLAGFRIKRANIQSVPSLPRYLDAKLKKLVAENRTVPTLKSLSAMKIRLEMGRRTSEFMDMQQFPYLRDFVLLKHINPKKMASTLTNTET